MAKNIFHSWIKICFESFNSKRKEILGENIVGHRSIFRPDTFVYCEEVTRRRSLNAEQCEIPTEHSKW